MAVIDNEEVIYKECEYAMQEFDHGICYIDSRTKGACYYLEKFKCPVEHCKCTEDFSKRIPYEMHLENAHK